MEKSEVQKRKVEYSPEDKKCIQKAGVFSMIPGLGQFYNKQYFGGALFLAVFRLFATDMHLFGFNAFENLITLGSIPIEDHSLFSMSQGTLQILITLSLIEFLCTLYQLCTTCCITKAIFACTCRALMPFIFSLWKEGTGPSLEVDRPHKLDGLETLEKESTHPLAYALP
uniref:Maltose/maltodextrin ABC transporter, permease protein n=1 Tax=Vibrio coralliilyticus TaxID=190893 RepID=M1FW51_9VIBR|nr:maltose/maltodextrin ABC transporter, permease protein [Vibrio coralliilyticus]